MKKQNSNVENEPGNLIYIIRGHRVMLDADLARLYGVETKALVQATKRNPSRFPPDFRFSLSNQELRILRSQFVTSRLQGTDIIDDFDDRPGRRISSLEHDPIKSSSETGPLVLRVHGGRRHWVYAFTEQGVAMLSSVLKSPRAIEVNVEIMRAFVKLRALLGSNKELARRIEELEQKYDGQFRVVFQAIRELMKPETPKKRAIGFKS